VSADSDQPAPEEGMEGLSDGGDDPVLAGVSVAVASAVLTVAVALLVADGPVAVFVDGSGATLNIRTGPTVGWAFVAAHGIPIDVTAERWWLGGELVQSPVVRAIPPMTLAVGGYVVARLDDRVSVVAGARAGALVTIGYALVVAVAVFGTRVSVQSSYASITAGPAVGLGLLAGIVYPVLFGGLGGAAFGVTSARLSDRHRRRIETVAIAGVGVALATAVALAAV